MNTKKNKHKKPNKSPNPTPPQKIEKEEIQEKSQNVEKILEIPPKSDKTEEIVKSPTKSDKNPEIQQKSELIAEVTEIQDKSEVKKPDISEIVDTVSEKEKQEDTPKKPKRNKGKKKQQDDMDKEVPIEVAKEVAVIPEPIKEVMSESVEDKDILDETVIPSARKKKNKKKNQNAEERKEAQIPEEVSKELIEPIVEETEKVDPEIQELFSPKPDTPKDKKKKNKKKKRNDSEKSEEKDKEEISCTTAFQQLLVQEETQKEGNTNLTQDIAIVNIEPPTQELTPGITEMKPAEELKEMFVEFIEEKQPKEESKSKKKNKKDKKHPESIDEPPKSLVDPFIIEKLLEGSSDEIKPVLEPIEKILEAIEKEPSPKPKAKIAKPVEKKRKGKHDAPESTENVESEELKTEIKNDDKKETEQIIEKPEIKLEKVFPDIMELKVEQTQEPTKMQKEEKVTEVPEKVFELENIIIPDNKMGKKRKKSPKPKRKETNKNVSESADVFPEEPIKESVEVAMLVPEIKELEKPIKNIDQIDTKTDLPFNPSETQKESEQSSGQHKEIKNDPKPIIEETKADENIGEKKKEDITEEKKKVDDEGFETKTSKKKKKLPKIPKVEESAKLETALDTKIDEQQKVIQDTPEVLIDTSFSELEVRSAKTDESEGSICDIAPDITFVRATSELFDNNNNNTVIQEVVIEESKPNDPAISIIEGLVETPIPTPELIKSDIQMPELIKTDLEITECEAKVPAEEKTDLKSKMLEVNQDMEELRLSIERSLAEFTALDKGETEQDNKTILKVAEPIKQEQIKKDVLPEVIKEIPEIKTKDEVRVVPEENTQIPEPPVCPTRKDNKGKKRKGKESTQTSVQSAAQSSTQSTTQSTTTATSDTSQSKDNTKEEKEKTDKSKNKSDSKAKGKQKSADLTDDVASKDNDEKQKSKHQPKSQEKGKQKSDTDTSKDDDNEKSKSEKDSKEKHEQITDVKDSEKMVENMESTDFEPIENFEDALTSSMEDVNKTFELIADEADKDSKDEQKKLADNKPEINVTEDKTDTKADEKTHPVSQPKNFLGHYNIPVQSNKPDYKKEKNKTPNARQAKVKIKDCVDVDKQSNSTETKKNSQSQTDTKKVKKEKCVKESFTKVKNENEEYIYKYSFRKVFLQSACNVCFKDLSQMRVPCGYCNLVFYCGARHKDENWPQHQALCFAVSTLAHMKDQKHIYADAQNITGQEYRLLRMQMIVSSEKVLKRRLVPWEQEAMLYPRLCADVACREWRQGKLRDCDGCAQLSYCSDHPEHLPKSHQRWCKSYSLYQKLVTYQQTKGRLEPKLPTKVMAGAYEVPTKMNEVLAAMYEEKIDMNDIQYAALTQIATAPLTTACCLQLCQNKTTTSTNGICKNKTFTIHVVGAELQFEADALNKWEVFFLHLVPEVQELKVVLISKMLNPGNLPLDLLAKIKLCDNCRQNNRRVVFIFEDDKNYSEYRTSEDFVNPDIICAFNPSIQRSSIYNGNDPWPASITSIIKLKTPFIITSHTLTELRKDIAKIKQCTDNFKLILEPGFNNFASVRPDRNFISDDEMPLLFKNYCVSVVLGC